MLLYLLAALRQAGLLHNSRPPLSPNVLVVLALVVTPRCESFPWTFRVVESQQVETNLLSNFRMACGRLDRDSVVGTWPTASIGATRSPRHRAYELAGPSSNVGKPEWVGPKKGQIIFEKQVDWRRRRDSNPRYGF